MRKRLLTFLLAGAMVLSLAACSQQSNEQSQAADTQTPSSQIDSTGEETAEPNVVQTSGGLVQGTDEDGIYRFLGVPYATAKERFVPAEEVEPWEGILQAEQISGAWIQFAKTGVPGADGLPEWEPYTRESGATMIFDSSSRLAYHHDQALMSILAPDYEY